MPVTPEDTLPTNPYKPLLSPPEGWAWLPEWLWSAILRPYATRDARDRSRTRENAPEKPAIDVSVHPAFGALLLGLFSKCMRDLVSGRCQHRGDVEVLEAYINYRSKVALMS